MQQREAPYNRYMRVSPDDTVNQFLARDFKPHALYVGVGGDISVVNWDGTTYLFAGVPSGTILPITFQRINATSTTADQMLALVCI